MLIVTVSRYKIYIYIYTNVFLLPSLAKQFMNLQCVPHTLPTNVFIHIIKNKYDHEEPAANAWHRGPSVTVTGNLRLAYYVLERNKI